MQCDILDLRGYWKLAQIDSIYIVCQCSSQRWNGKFFWSKLTIVSSNFLFRTWNLSAYECCIVSFLTQLLWPRQSFCTDLCLARKVINHCMKSQISKVVFRTITCSEVWMCSICYRYLYWHDNNALFSSLLTSYRFSQSKSKMKFSCCENFFFLLFFIMMS